MSSSEDRTFGARLRQSRLAAGLSQEALAERAGLSAAAIAAIERGRRTAPRATTVALLVEALGLSPAERAVLITTGDRSAVAHTLEPTAPGLALPVPPTLLVGRERETEQVSALLRDSGAARRLVTLMGPGGIGKTRLALAVAEAVQRDYRDGVVFVDLASLREHRLVPATLARALGLRQEGGRSAQALLVAHLRTRHMLLVLDNFEQVLGAAPLLAELLVACPTVVLLVTSRTALRLRAEQRFAVRPLAVYAADRALAVDAILASPAVQLFVERARAVAPEFVLDANNGAAIAGICRQLDGLPLAIELAAARTAVLPPRTLLARLGQALRLLTDGASDLPPRQQTLWATLEWSYALLPAENRALFRWLSIFAGGCTLEAAEAVAPPAVGQDDVAAGLQILIDHSLLLSTPQADGGARFRMWQTVREYGLEQLATEAELPRTRQAHTAYFLRLAEQARTHLFSDDQVLWLAALEDEHDNLRAALGYARELETATLGLRLGGALWRFWYIRCSLTEGRYWLQQVLAPPAAANDSARLDALVGLAVIAYAQTDYVTAAQAAHEGVAWARAVEDRPNLTILLNILAGVARNQNDLQRAAALGQECVALAQALGDDWAGALSLHNLADVARLQGAYAPAEALARESLALAHRSGDRWSVVQADIVLGWIAYDQGDFPAAGVLFARCLVTARELDNTRDTAHALAGLAEVALAQDDHARAAELLDQSVALWRRLGDIIRLAHVLVIQGRLARAGGDYEQATGLVVEALRLCHEAGYRLGIAECLEALAGLAGHAMDQVEHGVQLVSQAAALRQTIGAPRAPSENAGVEVELSSARARLGQERFGAAWAAGGALSVDLAVSAALHQTRGWIERRTTASQTPKPKD